jgi:hypothetical protein
LGSMPLGLVLGLLSLAIESRVAGGASVIRGG